MWCSAQKFWRILYSWIPSCMLSSTAFKFHRTVSTQNPIFVLLMIFIDNWCKITQLIFVQLDFFIPIIPLFIREIRSTWLNFPDSLLPQQENLVSLFPFLRQAAIIARGTWSTQLKISDNISPFEKIKLFFFQ